MLADEWQANGAFGFIAAKGFRFMSCRICCYWPHSVDQIDVPLKTEAYSWLSFSNELRNFQGLVRLQTLTIFKAGISYCYGQLTFHSFVKSEVTIAVGFQDYCLLRFGDVTSLRIAVYFLKVEAFTLCQTVWRHMLGRVIHHYIQKGTTLAFCIMSLIPLLTIVFWGKG
jgi:hypothetical protein